MTTAAAPRALSYAEARERVLAAVDVLPGERIALADALGRPLLAPVAAPHPLPPFRNSAMDGVAVRAADLALASEASPVALAVVETLQAGHVATRALAAGEAMRIMTGAPVPDGADAIVPVEACEFMRSPQGRERVRLSGTAPEGQHIREAGLDLAAGEVAVEAGRALTPHDLALLAAVGAGHVTVGRRPHAVVISTGDELLDPDAALRPGAIRDSNLVQLPALLHEAGVRVVRALRVADDPKRVADAIARGLKDADIVLTIGGVSAGDFDPVKQSLATLEGAEAWRVAMRPGRPQVFGRVRGKFFYGLPGNPASVACVFEALVRPALRRMQGFSDLDRPRAPVSVATPIESRAGRTDFVRVRLAWRDGRLAATPVGHAVSGHLAPQSRAHALLVVPEARAALELGDTAEAWVWRWPEPHA